MPQLVNSRGHHRVNQLVGEFHYFLVAPKWIGICGNPSDHPENRKPRVQRRALKNTRGSRAVMHLQAQIGRSTNPYNYHPIFANITTDFASIYSSLDPGSNVQIRGILRDTEPVWRGYWLS